MELSILEKNIFLSLLLFFICRNCLSLLNHPSTMGKHMNYSVYNHDKVATVEGKHITVLLSVSSPLVHFRVCAGVM